MANDGITTDIRQSDTSTQAGRMRTRNRRDNRPAACIVAAPNAPVAIPPQQKGTQTMRHDPVRRAIRHGLLAFIVLPLAGCGQSEFAKQMTAICAEEADPGADCACIVGKLDAGLPDRVKPAFSALRWPLKPDPQDRERVFNEALRAAGVDPVDRQAVQSIQSEFRDAYNPMREELRAECGGDL